MFYVLLLEWYVLLLNVFFVVLNGFLWFLVFICSGFGVVWWMEGVMDGLCFIYLLMMNEMKYGVVNEVIGRKDVEDFEWKEGIIYLE